MTKTLASLMLLCGSVLLLAATKPAAAKPATAQADAGPTSAVESSAPPLQAVTERLLALCGYSENPEYFKRSLREFIGRGTGDPRNSN